MREKAAIAKEIKVFFMVSKIMGHNIPGLSLQSAIVYR
jgi:hypothetical protein